MMEKIDSARQRNKRTVERQATTGACIRGEGCNNTHTITAEITH
jgi:hypothetical protein